MGGLKQPCVSLSKVNRSNFLRDLVYFEVLRCNILAVPPSAPQFCDLHGALLDRWAAVERRLRVKAQRVGLAARPEGLRVTKSHCRCSAWGHSRVAPNFNCGLDQGPLDHIGSPCQNTYVKRGAETGEAMPCARRAN